MESKVELVSDAQEQSAAPEQLSVSGSWFSIAEFSARFGTLMLFALLVLFLSIQRSSTFPTWNTVQSVIDNSAPLLIIAVALTICMIAGEFDLSIAAVAGAAGVTSVAMVAKHGASVPVAFGVGLGVAVTFGIVNAVLVTTVRIPAFIVTLGTGSLAIGVAYWVSGGQSIFQGIPQGYLNMGGVSPIFGIAWVSVVALVVTLLVWIAIRATVTGRYLEAVGENPVAAHLVGINPAVFKAGAFVAASLLAGVAGIMLSARLAIGNPEVTSGLLLPAFAAVFLGAASFRPGHFNIPGTFLGVMLLQVVLIGVISLNLNSSAEHLFQGGILIVAVGISRMLNWHRK